jgi:hypothetical protein
MTSSERFSMHGGTLWIAGQDIVVWVWIFHWEMIVLWAIEASAPSFLDGRYLRELHLSSSLRYLLV